MRSFLQRLFVCGSEQIADFGFSGITHLVRVSNPGLSPVQPTWFVGALLQLWFGDVVSEADAIACKTTAPTRADLGRAVEFFRDAWRVPDSRVLVSCDHGASRSPALAYVFLADQLGPGREREAFSALLEICPDAVPNCLVVRLGDAFLQRHGALLPPLRDLYERINAEISANMV